LWFQNAFCAGMRSHISGLEIRVTELGEKVARLELEKVWWLDFVRMLCTHRVHKTHLMYICIYMYIYVYIYIYIYIHTYIYLITSRAGTTRGWDPKAKFGDLSIERKPRRVGSCSAGEW
jgi:hypothetical protein